ncbi:MAG: ATP-binding protein [Mariniblastus sp.]
MKKVLIVEDNLQLAAHWISLLEAEGLQVIHEVSTMAALDCLKSTVLDLVISDMVVCDESGVPSPQGGLVILAYIALNITIPPKVIAVSGLDAEAEFFATFHLLDSDKALLKPVPDETLLKRVRTLLAEQDREIQQRAAAKLFHRELLQNKFATDHSSQGIFWVSKDASIKYANRKAEELLGYSNDELCQLKVYDIDTKFPMDRWGFFWEQWKEPRLHQVESTHTRRDGSIYDTEVTISHLSFDDEEFVLASFRDITEKLAEQRKIKKYSQELESANEQLGRSNEDLGQFAYVASHDLQEPLRAISGFLQLLRDRYQGQLDEKASGYIDKSVAGAARMNQLINDLLHYSQVTREESDFVPVDLTQCVDLARKKLDELIKSSQAVIHVDQLPTINGIESLLVQLFQNLIGNAIKYAGDSPPKITVSAQVDAKGVSVHVNDNGIGIAAEYQDQVFVLFKRLHHREEHAGTGIGLTICQRVAERHGGEISVRSVKGEGSCFTVRFLS